MLSSSLDTLLKVSKTTSLQTIYSHMNIEKDYKNIEKDYMNNEKDYMNN